MGSGTDSRKKSDKVYIKRPMKRDVLGNVISSGGAQAADICLPSFDQKVERTAFVKDGMKVRLQANKNVYEIIIGANVIGKLTKRLSEMIMKCTIMGVRYSGELVEKKEGLYARFIRF